MVQTYAISNLDYLIYKIIYSLKYLRSKTLGCKNIEIKKIRVCGKNSIPLHSFKRFCWNSFVNLECLISISNWELLNLWINDWYLNAIYPYRLQGINNTELLKRTAWNGYQCVLTLVSSLLGKKFFFVPDMPFFNLKFRQQSLRFLIIVFLSEVGEFAIVVSTSLKNISMMTNILEFWIENNSFQVKF